MSDAIIDLHAHSQASDGSDTPAEVIGQAHAAGLHTIALTDHDTVSGWSGARAAARHLGVGFIPGIELSTQILDETTGYEPHSIHLLGYLVDPEDADLVHEMVTIRSHRDNRLQLMVEKLAEDYPIDWLEVRAVIPEGATPGRPHIAEVLIAKGIVADTTEAFANILAGDGPYHVPHYAPRLQRGIEIIRRAGGVPVLAHPLSRGGNPATDVGGDLNHAIARYRRWVDCGLMGVEIGHRENDPALTPQLATVARELDLIVTGSSDYHGSKKPNVLGEHSTSATHLQRIMDAGVGSEPLRSSHR